MLRTTGRIEKKATQTHAGAGKKDLSEAREAPETFGRKNVFGGGQLEFQQGASVLHSLV